MTPELQQRVQEAQPLLAELWQLQAQILAKDGLPEVSVSGTEPTRAELRADTYDNSHSLFLEWRAPTGHYLGHVVVHGSGQSYAEFDVLMTHPTKTGWVVESVVSWGPAGALKGELRLLQVPE